ncbi:pyruvate-flavodoxin oxidoreductase-related [Anaeramoeba flamelloides]|uniref:Pyruvate-flavodoxin oxidoreductase-related n=1 Tax=Anaeramoeba flamelloides TaxID=1746091 RepID=A0ABQ8YR03_9EUKA|nr:pyruvate-flavodoxin oxidoreductase-related [Anaeramoeba flamelloides]
MLLTRKKKSSFTNILKQTTGLKRSLSKKIVPLDGNTAASSVAYRMSENVFLFPITPATPMGENADIWNSNKVKNIYDTIPDVILMQSEGGAAGALHGALVSGGLPTTFTAAQGLLLMIPNMYRISGEFWPAVFHVSARVIGRNGLSIYGDQSDVMAVRSTGFSILCSGTVQECGDFALLSHLASLTSGGPFLHFFDGFRTSHEINSIENFTNEELKKFVDMDALQRHRERALNPEHPYCLGTIQQTDLGFQGIESYNKEVNAIPGIVENYMKKIHELTGRKYHLFDYVGHPEAEQIIIMMGSGTQPTEELIKKYVKEDNKKIGVIKVRLFRPFSKKHLLEAMPATVKKIAVLDKCKDSGSIGEPLYLDICCALHKMDVDIIGGRYGVHGKEFTPAMVHAVFENLNKKKPKNNFTVGINDDVTFTSLEFGEPIDILPKGTQQCLFWGIGSDGTVGANKNAIKIIVNNTDLYGQGHFAYSAHKSGGITISHLRFGPEPINASYEITNADYIACHCTPWVHKFDLLKPAKQNSIFLLNSPYNTVEELEKFLPTEKKREIAQKNLKFYNINASQIAEDVGLSGRINMVMQTAFFKLSQVIEEKKSIELLKKAIEKEYKIKGQVIIEKNWNAVDQTIENIVEINYPREKWLNLKKDPIKEIDESLPDYYYDIMEPVSKLEANNIPVSKFPFSGYMPSSTTQYEKRGIARTVPDWQSDKCVQCNLCSFVCPSSVIRPFLLTKKEAEKAPYGYTTIKATGVDAKDAKEEALDFKIQISPYDCTGCNTCVANCPTEALVMKPLQEVVDKEQEFWDYSLGLSKNSDKATFKTSNIKGSQFMKPLIEFPGACSGCNETPIVKLVTQLFGEQMMIANSTGCSCVWGGTLPSNPWTTNEKGYGPSWGQSLFEDTAEYGLGMAKAVQARRSKLEILVTKTLEDRSGIKDEIVDALKGWLNNFGDREKSFEFGEKVKELILGEKNYKDNKYLKQIIQQKDMLAKKSQWIIGGDGWAYDIGYGGLDHVLASGENLNILVLDSEVYSNTGGHASKSTPRSGVAKFTSSGKNTKKKDLGAMAMTYGDVYVASICLNADPKQALKALIEAEAYGGVSLVIAYTPCIAHGIRGGMGKTTEVNKLAVKIGYTSLYRFNPDNSKKNKPIFSLDSKKPKAGFEDFVKKQIRFDSLKYTYPELAKVKLSELEEDITEKYNSYNRIVQTQKLLNKKKKKK